MRTEFDRLPELEEPTKALLSFACAWNEDKRPEWCRANAKYHIDTIRATVEAELQFMGKPKEMFEWERVLADPHFRCRHFPYQRFSNTCNLNSAK